MAPTRARSGCMPLRSTGPTAPSCGRVREVHRRAWAEPRGYGATGAIGSAAVQLLADQGSVVTAFCRDQHADLVRGLGARTVVDYTTQDIATYPDRFDLVFDAVGKTTFAASKPLLGDRGRYVSSELGPHGQNLYLPSPRGSAQALRCTSRTRRVAAAASAT